MKQSAAIFRKYEQEIILTWENRVNTEIQASKENKELALRDHMPNILNDMADILDRLSELDNPEEDTTYQRILENSAEHGRHRATTRLYTVDEIVHEYIIFHRVITEKLSEYGMSRTEPINMIKYIIETSILKSVSAFSDALREMQQKLIGTLAHDIRNPLAAARLATEMLDYSYGAEHIAKVKTMTFNSVNKALSMVEGLLDSVSVKAGEGMLLSFTTGDLVEHVQSVHEEACEIYRPEFSFKCSEDEIHAVFDPIALRRLIENLITNAVKYGDSDRPITIRLENTEDWVQLSVHNYGNPIDEDKQQSIFQFLEMGDQTSNTELHSWGIGLSLVKMVAEAHGGRVELNSSQEEGTTFMVTLHKHPHPEGKVHAKLNFKERS